MWLPAIPTLHEQVLIALQFASSLSAVIKGTTLREVKRPSLAFAFSWAVGKDGSLIPEGLIKVSSSLPLASYFLVGQSF